MLFVRDKGRLCNNILQYAHAYAWGREHGVATMSTRFAYKYKGFAICNTKWHWTWVYIVAKTLAQLKIIPVVSFHEPALADTDDKLSADLLKMRTDREREMQNARLAVVEGWYLRFYDLFLKYKGEILNLFAFDKGIKDKIGGYMQTTSMAEDIKLGVHIRRGDYKTFKGGKYFYDDDTYIRFIQTFASKHPDRTISVYICGNDPNLNIEYFRTELTKSYQGRVSILFPQGSPVEDLCMLSECDYIIGAPSTFSLVGAMYNDRPLLWMHSSDASMVNDTEAWGKFDYLFKHIE